MRPPRYVDHRAAIRKNLKDIDEIVTLANEQPDLLVQAYLMRLATIRLSGFVEQSVGAMIHGYLHNHTTARVLSFSTRQAGKMANLNPAKLEQLVGSFDSGWREKLTEFLAKDENRQTLGNLIEARHQLAHGSETPMRPSLLSQYHRVATETVEFLGELFLAK